MFAPVFESTRYLDCVSSDLAKAGVDSKGKLSVYLGAMPNTAGPKVGRVELPTSIQPFVRSSLDRVSSGFRLLSDEESVQYRLSGSLYSASPVRVLESEIETLGFGLGSKVEAADIGIQLFWETRVPKTRTFEQSGTGVTFNIRLFSAEQGSSAFVISTGKNGITLGRTRASQEAMSHHAIQSAINVAMAALIKAAAGRQWNVTSSCDLGSEGQTAIPHDTLDEPFKPTIDVKLALTKGKLCAQIKPRYGFEKNIDAVLEISEFRAEGIELRRQVTNVAPLDELIRSNSAVCFPKEAFDDRAEEVRFWFKTRNGRQLGGTNFFFR